MPATPRYLLDTNILVAFIRKGQLGEYVERTYHLRAPGIRPTICVVSIGEILSLAKQFEWQEEKVATMAGLLKEFVWVDIRPPEICEAYAEIDYFSKTSNITMGKNDIWIAAASKVTASALLTADRDFDHLADSHINRIWIDEKAVRSR